MAARAAMSALRATASRKLSFRKMRLVSAKRFVGSRLSAAAKSRKASEELVCREPLVAQIFESDGSSINAFATSAKASPRFPKVNLYRAEKCHAAAFDGSIPNASFNSAKARSGEMRHKNSALEIRTPIRSLSERRGSGFGGM